MKVSPRAPIPILLRQRWQDFRLDWLPGLVFLAALGTLGWLCQEYVAAPTPLETPAANPLSSSGPNSP